jgi:hypothetical protein
MSIVLIGSTSGSITLQEPAVSGSTVIDLPATSGTMVVTGGAQTVQFAAGSASTPSITFTGDTNTGIFSPGADTIAFTEGGTESMRIDSSGNVGIGTSSPANKLVVSGTGAVSTRTIATDTGGDAAIFATNNASSIAGPLVYGTTKAAYGALGSGETAFYSNAACTILSENVLKFTAGGNAERMRIDTSGNLLVTGGNTSTSVAASIGMRALQTGFWGVTMSATTNATDTLNVYSTGASNYRFYVGMAGTVFATSTTISAISDVRLKENIQDIDVGLDKVMALKPRKFDWKEGKGKDKKGDRGWIAQEFEQVFPEMINEWKDPAPEGEEPYKAVNADLIPVLVKAIQEQQAIITDLKARIETLENK